MAKADMSSPRVSSPYSSGGGGVAFEDWVGALALARLLLGRSFPGLPASAELVLVQFQQGINTPVDDFVLKARADSQDFELHIHCRANPPLIPSEAKTVKLFESFLRVMRARPEVTKERRFRLGLVVAEPHNRMKPLATLADLAREQHSLDRFSEEVLEPYRYGPSERSVWGQVQELTAKALERLGDTADPVQTAYELLGCLWPKALDLNRSSGSGHEAAIDDLAQFTLDRRQAGELWEVLGNLASDASPFAGSIDARSISALLRERGLEIGPRRAFLKARPFLQTLEQALIEDTPRSIETAGAKLRLPRAALQAHIDAFLKDESSILLVTGEADVGKSALVIQSALEARAAGTEVVMLNLRDLGGASAIDLDRALGGHTPGQVLAHASTAHRSLLVLDGGEVVLEGADGPLKAWLRGATDCGFHVVVTTRRDGVDLLASILRSFGWKDESGTLEVPPLQDRELQEMTAAFPALERLSQDERSRELIARLGVAQVLVQATSSNTQLPSTLGSEAEVLELVWDSIVRDRESNRPGRNPDEREDALDDLARAQLINTKPRLLAQPLAGLRSDGILTHRRGSTLRGRDDFALDVWRDFATARVLIDDLSLVDGTPSSRKALRALRIALQSEIKKRLQNPLALRAWWAEMERHFDAIAEVHGLRWRELPWEALLAAAWSGDALDVLTPHLLGSFEAWHTLMQVQLRRFGSAGITNALIGEPVVHWLMVNQQLSAEEARDTSSMSVQVVLAWLRDVAVREALGAPLERFSPTRRLVRERLLELDELGTRGDWITALGLLGCDSDEQVDHILVTLARDEPEDLQHLVEDRDVAELLASTRAETLVDLAKRYYIRERPEPAVAVAETDDVRLPYFEPPSLSSPEMNFGFRHHLFDRYSFTASWDKGCFYTLLRRDAALGLALIGELVGHAVSIMREAPGEALITTAGPEDLTVDVLGLGERTYLGTGNSWSWYRGMGIGPDVPMSALLAVEAWMDRVLEGNRLPLLGLARAVLDRVPYQPALALVFGALVRHHELVTDEFDDFLQQPEVWANEVQRANRSERSLPRGRPLRDDTDRRRVAPNQVAEELVLRALGDGDIARIEQLKDASAALSASARDDPRVASWAGLLDPNRYRLTAEGLEFDPGEEFLSKFHDVMGEAYAQTLLIRLEEEYGSGEGHPYKFLSPLADPARLDEAIQSIEMIPEELVPTLDPRGTAEVDLAIACAYLRAQLQSGYSREGVAPHAALDSLLEHSGLESEAPRARLYLSPQVALALCLALRARPDSEQPSQSGLSDRVPEIIKGLKALATRHTFDTTRAIAQGIGQLSSDFCYYVDGHCWHEHVLDLVLEMARRSTLGDYDPGLPGIPHLVIEGDVTQVLHEAKDDHLYLPQVLVALQGMLELDSMNSCVSELAEHYVDVLLGAYTRATISWADHNFINHQQDGQRQALMSALVRNAGIKGSARLSALAEGLAPRAKEFARLLRDLAVIATYEPDVIDVLSSQWLRLVAVGFEVEASEAPDPYACDDGDLLASLLPTPSPSMYFGDFQSQLLKSRANWFGPGVLLPHLDAWVSAAQFKRPCVSNLVDFLVTQDVTDQLDWGIKAVAKLVLWDDGIASNSAPEMPDWLEALRTSGRLEGVSLVAYQRLVDGLAALDYRGSSRLQRLEE